MSVPLYIYVARVILWGGGLHRSC